ncbi:MAG: AraC family transcriptional regulator [Cyanobacteria bacterium J06634_5]
MRNQPLPGLARNIVKAWRYHRPFHSPLLELYSYIPDKPEKLPAHYHDEYQFCLSVNYPSESYYQKSVHFVPAGSFSIIHPGEMHSGTGKDVGNGRDRATFRMMYLSSEVIAQVTSSIFQASGSLPYFSDSILLDRAVTLSFSRFHSASQHHAPQLQQDEQLQQFLTLLIGQYAERQPLLQPTGQERPAIKQVRTYLQQHYTCNIGLERLAKIVSLSSSYLSRVFKAEVGISLSQYQTQLRINRAKSLLLSGASIKRTASDLGFSDQSHFTHAFKRLVHTTPGRYIQDSS